MLKLILCASLFLAGCSTSPDRNAEPVNSYPAPSKAGNAPLNLQSSTVGDAVDVEGGSMTVTGQYTAASGRICKKLQKDSAPGVWIACEARSGSWYLRKPLVNPQNSKGSVASHQTVDTAPLGETVSLASPESSVVVMDTSTDGRSFAVLPGENLWRFSKRVTGNATNWQTIASYNGITDAKVLTAGEQLIIPPGLAIRTVGN